MTGLARKLGLRDYFALAFGTMIGSGWLVLMDDWLGRGGPLGVMLGFAIGALVLLPVGYVYSEWVKRMPEAVGEAAYTARVFPPILSYFTGWMMLLAYFIVCRGSSSGWQSGGIPVSSAEFNQALPRGRSPGIFAAAGAGNSDDRVPGSAELSRHSRKCQFSTGGHDNGAGAGGGGCGDERGTRLAREFPASFSGGAAGFDFLVLQIVPCATGFESVPKAAEEAGRFPATKLFRAIVMALLTGAGFYIAAAAAVSVSAPWQSLLGKSFVTALALGQAIGTEWPIRAVLAAAMMGLLQCFNGNFVAASRMIFSFGRSGTVPARFAAVHPRFQTPYMAVIGISVATLVALFLGDALLVPVTEVGSMASATGWFAASLSLFMLEKRPRPGRRWFRRGDLACGADE
jgi:amino acid transporter